MERRVTTARSDLEQMLVDENAEPKALPLSLLEDITDGFSPDQKIGSGGFAVVYKGILGDRAVAVKRLTNPLMDETDFHREVQCLMRVKHKNVVRFLGYCANREGNMQTYDGKLVMADVHERLLCFEYIPRGGLDKYIIDAYREWETCYEIIKGICEGIRYLHENNIIHLDLKPANILLDDDMIPKITDFGLSRCFDENQSRHITKNVAGTIGYLAPELCKGGVIARSADMYSLGVIIIEILTGQRGYEAIEDVLENWSYKLERSERHTLCEQIQVCNEIASECIEFNPKKRPTSAGDIIDRLHEMESIQETNSDMGGEASQQKKNLEKEGIHGEEKKNHDRGGGGGKEKKNPNIGGKQENSLDRGADDGMQEKNVGMRGESGEHNKQEKNAADKVDKAGLRSQPKEDKGKRQSAKEADKEKRQLVHNELSSVHGSAPTEESTVLLRIRPLHCDACARRILQRICQVQGVKDVVVDRVKDEVKVVGTMDGAAMVVYLKEKLSRPREGMCPQKKDAKKEKSGSGEKKHKDKVAPAKGIEVSILSIKKSAAAPVAAYPYGNAAYLPPVGAPYGNGAYLPSSSYSTYGVKIYEEDASPCSVM